MRAHAFGHFQADRAVAQADDAGAEERAYGHGAQPEDAQADYGDVFPGAEERFAIAVGAEGVEVGKIPRLPGGPIRAP